MYVENDKPYQYERSESLRVYLKKLRRGEIGVFRRYSAVSEINGQKKREVQQNKISEKHYKFFRACGHYSLNKALSPIYAIT